nr:mesoderm induction early response protein 1 [Ipomoea batatas]
MVPIVQPPAVEQSNTHVVVVADSSISVAPSRRQTGEVYYINWRTGMKVKEDPRITKEYSSEESGSSSEESTLSSSRDVQRRRHAGSSRPESSTAAAVLVVAGCKTCLMYFMVPKEVDDCPKCCGQLLHFDRSDNSSP